MNREKSCGAIVFTRVDGEVKFLIAKSVKGAAGFPKGHVEGNESEHQTARREIYEEVGLHPRFIKGFRVKEEYVMNHKPDTIKTVIYFLAEFNAEKQEIRCQKEEIQSAQLLTYPEAIRALPFYRKRYLRSAFEFMAKRGLI